MEVSVKVISQQIIKPSSPTPDHLRPYRLSFLDQISVPVFMPFVLFYPKDPTISNTERSNRVKKSLSEALTHFYPLAGRVKDNTHIHFDDDEGIHFFEAQANCKLSHILQNPIPCNNNKFLPLKLDDLRDLAAVSQITFFECGGIAIGLGISHKVGDALSFFMFLNSWAAIARGDGSKVIVPRFDSAALFPPQDTSDFQFRTGIVKEDIVSKRFMFDGPTIAAIRDKFTKKGSNSGGEQRRPTRVEALSAFIWNRFMASTRAEANAAENNKIHTVLHAVNLRTRMDPPLSEQYFGNISRVAIAVVKKNEDYNKGTQDVLKQMREAIKSVNGDYMRKLQEGKGHLEFLKERSERMEKGEVVSFSFTSLCRFPMYEADFGWGKPVWVGSARLTFKNLATFFDTNEGNGIEAWISLLEEDMAKFERDEELTAHASPSPTTYVNTSWLD